MLVGYDSHGLWELYVFAEGVVRAVPSSDIWAIYGEVPFGIQVSP